MNIQSTTNFSKVNLPTDKIHPFVELVSINVNPWKQVSEAGLYFLSTQSASYSILAPAKLCLSNDQIQAVLEECYNNSGTKNHNGVRSTRDGVVAAYHLHITIKKDVTDWVKSVS